MIAHRLSTVRYCDSIVLLENGKVVAEGSYEDLLKNSLSFRNLASEKQNNKGGNVFEGTLNQNFGACRQALISTSFIIS